MVALGKGAQQKVLADIAGHRHQHLEIFPGEDFGDMRSGRIQTLVAADADALAAAALCRQRHAHASRPAARCASATSGRHGSVNGVGDQYFRVRGIDLRRGHGSSTRAGVRDRAQGR